MFVVPMVRRGRGVIRRRGIAHAVRHGTRFTAFLAAGAAGGYVAGVLPYAFLRPVHLKCPHCGRAETRLRASAVPGAKHVCPYCKKSYEIDLHARRRGSVSSGKK